MGKNRHQYINEVWQAYPSAPEGDGWNMGRLESMKKEASGLRLCLKRDFSFQSVKCTNILMPNTSWSALDVLIEGDLIAVRDSELVLLAPKLVDEPRLHSSEFDKEMALLWQGFEGKLHEFFKKRGFVSLATPSLVPSAGVEIFVEPFETLCKQGSLEKRMFLPSSPEFHLKKALCIGFDKVYEIAKVFRNNESGNMHQLEFWMLEWYRSYDNLGAIIQDTKDLLQEIFSLGDLPVFTMQDLFSKCLGVNLLPQTTSAELKIWCDKLQVNYLPEEDFDDLFFRLFVEKVEPHFAHMGWFGICDYPPSQAALARLNERGWADRFEFYFGQVELGNGFHELNNPSEQERRFQAAVAERKQKTGRDLIYDQELLDYMKFAMPPSGGIAVGVDRLFAVFAKQKGIESSRLFPFQI